MPLCSVMPVLRQFVGLEGWADPSCLGLPRPELHAPVHFVFYEQIVQEKQALADCPRHLDFCRETRGICIFL